MNEINPNAYYILNEEGIVVEETDVLKWAHWFEQSANQRVLERTTYTWQGNEISISTSFLSLASPFKEKEGWALFETMVFAPDNILQKLMDLAEKDTRSIIGVAFNMGAEIQERYATKEEAIAGHKTMCAFVETALRFI